MNLVERFFAEIAARRIRRGSYSSVDDLENEIYDYGTSGRMTVWVSAMTLCATSTPAAPSVATPAAPPPFVVRLSAKTSRVGGVSVATIATLLQTCKMNDVAGGMADPVPGAHRQPMAECRNRCFHAVELQTLNSLSFPLTGRSERTREGLEAAKRRGRVGGRPPALTAAQRIEVRRMRDEERRPLQEIASLFKVSARTARRA